MNKFLFVTPLTPSRLLTPLRKLLFSEFLIGLKNQQYENWEAILIGEVEKVDGNIKYIKIGAESKEIKLIFARQFIQNMESPPDYIIRIDDDDVINPQLLKYLAAKNFDCFADEYHTFYDVVSGRVSQQRRHFLANTVVHKTFHAMALTHDDIPLLQADHSGWLDYYRNKGLKYTTPEFPVYLRVLSPTTVTNGIFGKTGSISTLYNNFKEKISAQQKVGDIELNSYNQYLRSHGRFKSKIPDIFKTSCKRLDLIWEKFSGEKRSKSILQTITGLWTKG